MKISRTLKVVTCVVLCMTLIVPCALATSNGGGGGDVGGSNPQDNRVFINQRPGVPGGPAVPDSVWGIPPRYWDAFENTLMVLDISGSVATLFVPGAGWARGYKALHGGIKGTMAYVDQNKRNNITRILGF